MLRTSRDKNSSLFHHSAFLLLIPFALSLSATNIRPLPQCFATIMKPTLAVASLALIGTVSAQGHVDPAKLPKGWCIFYTESVCAEEIVPASCGTNSSYSSSCISTFSNDKVCTSFNISCVCTPTSGGQQKDVSMDALNRTFGRKYRRLLLKDTYECMWMCVITANQYLNAVP